MSSNSPVYRLHFPQATTELFVAFEPTRVHGFFKFPDGQPPVNVEASYHYEESSDRIQLSVNLTGSEHQTVLESASTYDSIALDQHGKGHFSFELTKTHGEQTAMINGQPIGVVVDTVLPMVEVTIRKAIEETAP